MKEPSILLNIFVFDDDPDDGLLTGIAFAGNHHPLSLYYLSTEVELLDAIDKCLSESRFTSPKLIIINTIPTEKFLNTLEHIRNITYSYPNIYVAGMISSPSEADIVDLDQLGLVGFVEKPLTPQNLTALLKAAPPTELSGIDFSDYS